MDIKLDLTEQELKVVERAAGQNKMEVSDYLRMLAMKGVKRQVEREQYELRRPPRY